MATDTPLIRDGGQMTAFANYFNPGSALAGPGGSGQFLAMGIQAARVVQVQTTIGGFIYGILQNTPVATDPADLGIFGVSKVVAGVSLSAGNPLMSDASGRMILWVSGSGYYKCGYALEAPGAANTVFSAVIFPSVTA